MEAVETRRRRLTVSTSSISQRDSELIVEETVTVRLNASTKKESVIHRLVKVFNLISVKMHLYIITKKVKIGDGEEEEEVEIIKFENLEPPLSIIPPDVCQYEIVETVFTFDDIKTHNLMNETLDSFMETMDTDKMHTVLYITHGETEEKCLCCEEYDKAHIESMKLNEELYPEGSHYLNEFFFVLGSTSLSRKYVMEHNRLDYMLVSTNINERCIGNRKTDHPFVITVNIAIGKLMKLQNIIENDQQLKKQLDRMSRRKRVILVTGDELIYCNGQIYEKPQSEEEAAAFLRTYANNVCSSYCSVCICDYGTKRILTGVDKTDIKVRPLSEQSIHEITQDSYVYFCSGAFKIEHDEMSKHIECIRGRVDSIFGLSVKLLTHLVRLL